MTDQGKKSAYVDMTDQGKPLKQQAEIRGRETKSMVYLSFYGDSGRIVGPFTKLSNVDRVGR